MSEERNRLGREASSYLKSAAHQPIHWYPWGEEAFRKAREEDKPILLDIGAVWCHWCHVMDHESYEDEEVARIINENFVAVKVDRDERPDIDSRYQTAVGAITGRGGWPLTAFLTPEGRTFYGGTYFPPEERHGLPSIKTVLKSVAAFYRNEKEKALEAAKNLNARIASLGAEKGKGGDLSPGLILKGLEQIRSGYDFAYGGFGREPKFPHPSAIDFLLRRYFAEGERWVLTIINTTLERMGKGGVYDQIGGGFHRYSVDEKWIVPHFEKMSYDNSELLKNYLHAYQLTGNEFFREVASGIIGWVDGVLSDRERGGFYASQDADIGPGDDGDFFTWTVAEAKETLSPQGREVICLHYNIYERGEMHINPDKNVLYVDKEPEEIASLLKLPVEEVREIIASGKRQMLVARSGRPTPFVDKAIYTNWNGMMASAYLEACGALGSTTCRDFALLTLDRITREGWAKEGGFYHQFTQDGSRVWGLLDDQVRMGQALLGAYCVTGERRYLEGAVVTADFMIGSFWDEEAGGFFDTAPNARGLVTEPRLKPIQDAPSPSANSVAVQLLDSLYHLTGREDYREKAKDTLRAFAGVAADYGLFAAQFFSALDGHLNHPLQVVVVGERADQRTKALHEASLSIYWPGKLTFLFDPAQGDEVNLPAAVRGMIGAHEGPRAYVCCGNTCYAPVAAAGELRALIGSLRAGGK